MRVIKLSVAVCSLGLFVFCVGRAWGQTSFGSIVGTVTDPSGAGIPDANVTLKDAGTDERRIAKSDTSGTYSFVNLIPGDYQIEVRNPGFKTYSRAPIRIEVESAVRVDAPLQVGNVSEVMTVSDQAPLLETQSGTIGEVIEGRTVQDTPLNGRNPLI